MKLGFFILLATLTITAFGGSKLVCPDGTRQVVICYEIDGNHDGVVAYHFMNGAIVCADQRNDLSIMFRMRDHDELSPALSVLVEGIPGSNNYTAQSGESNFMLSHIIGQSRSNATFSLSSGGNTSSRPLSCK